MKLEITSSEFEFTHYDTSERHSASSGDYEFFNVDAWNSITINDKTYCASYQTGHTFYDGDMHCPTNDFTLLYANEAGNTHLIFELLNELSGSDFEIDNAKHNEFMNDTLKKIMDEDANINSLEKMEQVYFYLCNNCPDSYDLDL